MDSPLTGRLRDGSLMGDDTFGPAQNLMSAALDEFSARGYHATTTRHIASSAGLSPAAIYVHFRSKNELLFAICVEGHTGVKHAVDAVVARLSDRPPHERLEGVVIELVRWHADNSLLARVIQSELRSLETDAYTTITELRRALEQTLSDEVRLAHREFGDDPERLGLATTAAWSLVIDLARWYRPQPRRNGRDFVTRYAHLVLRMLALEAKVDE